MGLGHSYPITLLEEQVRDIEAPSIFEREVSQTQHDHASISMCFGDTLYNWDPSLSPDTTNDQLGWDQMLREIVDGVESQSSVQHADPVSVCECFATALKVIEQLCRYQDGNHNYPIDHLLQVSDDAIRACDAFLNCGSSCHNTHLLLYITILQQIDKHHSCLSQHLAENASGWETLEVQLRVGTFEVKTGLCMDIARAVLKVEMERAATCALRLLKVLPAEVNEDTRGCADELKCQQGMLATLTGDLYRGIKK